MSFQKGLRTSQSHLTGVYKWSQWYEYGEHMKAYGYGVFDYT